MAELVRAGVIRPGGRLSRELAEGFPIAEGLALLPEDIDMLQRAKAGVAAATLCLLERAGVRLGDLRRIVVGGTFGRFLHVANAQAIGLLPSVASARVDLYGNTALAGCERLLFADAAATQRSLAQRATLINLPLLPQFEARFIDNLRLQPMRAVTGREVAC